jgi:AbrB family looped-hinge helix DNA binding protein
MMTVTVGPDGRILVPVELRRQLGLAAGMPLVARVEDQRLVLERREVVLERLRAQFRNVPSGVSLTDELIADRRREARRDSRPGSR